MSTFVVKKRIELAHLGEGWEQAYLIFSPFSFADNETLIKFRGEAAALQGGDANEKEIEKVTNRMLQLILGKFVEGKGFDGKTLIDITKENFAELPMEVFNLIVQQLQGEQLRPNA